MTAKHHTWDARSAFGEMEAGMPSTVIRRISYDEETRTLFVSFVSGACYAYLDVPPETFADFKAAFSKGQFFAGRIRDRFAYRQMQTDGG